MIFSKILVKLYVARLLKKKAFFIGMEVVLDRLILTNCRKNKELQQSIYSQFMMYLLFCIQETMK
jgi:hypothetical protein